MWFALVLLAVSPIPADSRQLVVSVSADWEAPASTVAWYERSGDDAWRLVGGPVPASLGRAGLGWGRGLHPLDPGPGEGPRKREGDGRAPAGVFLLRGATGHTAEAPADVKLPYSPATATLRCVDDPASSHYNSLVDEADTTVDWTSAELMRRSDDKYRSTVWVGHNDSPALPGAGSCIFLHLREKPDDVTAGCTALEAGDLELLLRWLDPAARPTLVQLPASEWRRLQLDWSLPARP